MANRHLIGSRATDGRMGAAKCTTLTFEEKCDDLVGTFGGG
jgi:hypothetical protein